MHLRLPLWLTLFAFFAVSAIRAQTPPPAATSEMPPGQIKAVNVKGSVNVIVNGQTMPLHENDFVSQSAAVVTQTDASVILVFSNGATTQLGSDSNLIIDQFLQDPFDQQVVVAKLTAEPSISHTKLHLTKGELVGNVKHLNHDKGSTFTIETPVGAAGIRGTTFRIIFRPSGTGHAFAIFSVSTLEGNVVFNNASSQGQPSGSSGTPQGQGQKRGGSVAVTTGQEVVVTVTVETNPVTGQVTVTSPIQLATTTPLNPVVRASLVSQATTMATTVEQSGTSFTSSSGASSGGASSGSNSGSSGSSTGSGSSTDSGSSSDSGSSTGSGSSTSSGGTSGGSTTGSTSTSTGSGSGTTSSAGVTSGSTSTGAASTLTSSIAGGRQINTTPGFTGSPATLTPGAGG